MGLRLHYAIFYTELGWVGVMGSSDGLCRLSWHKPSAKKVLADLSSASGAIEDILPFGDLPLRLQRYCRGERVDFPDKLDLSHVTPFQRAVLERVHCIPYGETRSYAWAAKSVGKVGACRAVGQVLARNPIPIVIPCHRVVGSDGSLVGFGGGLELKRYLLQMEASNRFH